MIAALTKAWAAVGWQLLRQRNSGIPYILAKSAVPVILAPNGTVATNGTITLSTALPTTYYGGAWVRLPAGAVSGGLAGLYWVVFSSMTVGAVKNVFVDPATAFIPYIPTGTLVNVTGSNVGYAQTTATTTLINIAITGGLLGPVGGFRLQQTASCIGNANGKVLETKLGTAQIGYASASGYGGMHILSTCLNRGVATQQISTRNPLGASSTAHFATVNTAADTSVNLTAQMNVATDYVVIECFILEILQ